jgi:hypothetical protein
MLWSLFSVIFIIFWIKNRFTLKSSVRLIFFLHKWLCLESKAPFFHPFIPLRIFYLDGNICDSFITSIFRRRDAGHQRTARLVGSQPLAARRPLRRPLLGGRGQARPQKDAARRLRAAQPFLVSISWTSAEGDRGFCLFTFFDASRPRCLLVFRRKKTIFFVFRRILGPNFNFTRTAQIIIQY